MMGIDGPTGTVVDGLLALVSVSLDDLITCDEVDFNDEADW